VKKNKSKISRTRRTKASSTDSPIAGKNKRTRDLIEIALRALVARLDAVHADPRYAMVWQLSQLHCGPYVGPQYIGELEAARHALKVAERQ
jgi:hypothetical protein